MGGMLRSLVVTWETTVVPCTPYYSLPYAKELGFKPKIVLAGGIVRDQYKEAFA